MEHRWIKRNEVTGGSPWRSGRAVHVCRFGSRSAIPCVEQGTEHPASCDLCWCTAALPPPVYECEKCNVNRHLFTKSCLQWIPLVIHLFVFKTFLNFLKMRKEDFMKKDIFTHSNRYQNVFVSKVIFSPSWQNSITWLHYWAVSRLNNNKIILSLKGGKRCSHFHTHLSAQMCARAEKEQLITGLSDQTACSSISPGSYSWKDFTCRNVQLYLQKGPSQRGKTRFMIFLV